MEQYYRLFSSYRVPGIEKDKLVESHTNLALEPEHVIVISHNQVKSKPLKKCDFFNKVLKD